MNLVWKSRALVFLLSFLIWVALTDIRDGQEVIAALIIAVIVSLLAGHLLITTEKTKHLIHRLFSAFIYFIKFLWEMIKANIHVAYLVAHPLMPIKPGIVKIKTKLTKDSGLTVLANSITLTPGTLTIDIDKDNQELYIHWIDVKTIDTQEATEEIGGRFEHRLTEVFE